jgi:hypothetical protein
MADSEFPGEDEASGDLREDVSRDGIFFRGLVVRWQTQVLESGVGSAILEIAIKLTNREDRG